MRRRWTATRRRWKLALVLIGACAVVLAIWLISNFRFDAWLYGDAGRLGPYPTVLIQNGVPVQEALRGDVAEAAINQALVDSNTKQRLVVHLSRSEIRYSLFRRRAYVKIYLETSLPGDSDRVERSIKFLNVLTREDDTWSVVPGQVKQLSLQ